MSDLKTTKLHTYHTSKNAKFINFAGWSMPFSYEGTLLEHNRVRQTSGFFDVSHMGRLILDYHQIKEINSLICSELKSLNNTKALYTVFSSDEGNALDDVIFWKFQDELVLICNASNTEKIKNHLLEHNIYFQDVTLSTSLIAVQGLNAIELLSTTFDIPDKFSTKKMSHFSYARTGYTGEDGIEIMVDNENVEELLRLLESLEILPCGLGSRDTLRLEASLPLYGFELSEKISPVEAGLKWTITNENDYLGKKVHDQQLLTGNHKVLKKFILNVKNIARTDTLCSAGKINGVVTSGNISPVLGHPIGFALFETKPDTDLAVFDIRGNLIEGKLLNKRFLS